MSWRSRRARNSAGLVAPRPEADAHGFQLAAQHRHHAVERPRHVVERDVEAVGVPRLPQQGAGAGHVGRRRLERAHEALLARAARAGRSLRRSPGAAPTPARAGRSPGPWPRAPAGPGRGWPADRRRASAPGAMSMARNAVVNPGSASVRMPGAARSAGMSSGTMSSIRSASWLQQATGALAGIPDHPELHDRDGRASVPVAGEGLEHDAVLGRPRHQPIRPGGPCPAPAAPSRRCRRAAPAARRTARGW